jgi:hypothetical protein
VTGARFNHARVGINFEIVKTEDFDAGFFKRGYGFIDVSGGNKTMISDEQGALKV